MISGDDIEAFSQQFGDDMRQAGVFCNRAERGLPTDRWAVSQYEMYSVARGIRGLQRLVAMQTAIIEGLSDGDKAT